MPKRVLILRGVHFRLLDRYLNENILKKLSDDGIIEKKCFVLSRNENFEVFFAGTNDNHVQWIKAMRQCCLLHHFKYNYKPIKQISQGSQSTIFEALSLETNEIVAVKLFEKKKLEKTYADQNNKHLKIFLSVENEINILRSLEHENIVQLKEVYENKTFIHLVLEDLKGGDLLQRVVDKKKELLNEDNIKNIIKQLADAVNYIHERNIMHRDLKLENIIFLQSNDMKIKLADFGLAEYCKKKEYLFTKCGTPGYVAPEVFAQNKYDKKCDMFSFGVILFVL